MEKKACKNSTRFALEAFEDRSQMKNMGLLKGRAGVAFVYFLLARQTNEARFAEIGSHMLDEISDNSHLINGSTFEEGFTGIGWAIEWLVQNELMKDTNTDEVLDSIDNELYKVVSYSKDDNISLYTGTTGKIAYFLKRELSLNYGTDFYKRIGHKECFVLLTDDLENVVVCDKVDNGESQKLITIADLSSILGLISGIKINLNKPTLEAILYETIKRAEMILSNAELLDISGVSVFERLNLLYLAICYLVASEKHEHTYWKSRALYYINYFTSVPIDVSDNTSLFFRKLITFSLLNVYTPSEKYSKEIQELIDYSHSLEISNSLYEGRGTVVLSELCLQNKNLISDWHEIFFF